MRSLTLLVPLLALLLLPRSASSQVYDARGLEAAAQLTIAGTDNNGIRTPFLSPVQLERDEAAKVWLIGGTAAVVIGAVVGGDGGTVLIVGGVAGVAYGVYRATR